jgi:hypothetical protein
VERGKTVDAIAWKADGKVPGFLFCFLGWWL